jgi:hypothetical protein
MKTGTMATNNQKTIVDLTMAAMATTTTMSKTML